MSIQVQDVAQALANISQDTNIHSTTFNLPGPVTFNYSEMQKLISLFTFRPVSGVPEVPKRIAMLLSRLSQRIWWPSLSPDEIERRFIDDVMVDATQDWAALGVNPVEIEKIATAILRRYRSGYVNLTSWFVLCLICSLAPITCAPWFSPAREGRPPARLAYFLVQPSCSPNETHI